MLVAEEPKLTENISCFHCGEPCLEHNLKFEEKNFCCNGCKTVYEILSQNNLCDYYGFEQHPGMSLKKPINKTKFSILDNKDVREKLISFSEKNQTHVTFLLPTIHCSSCIWILENLHKINSNIINSRVDFLKKEIKIIFNENKISLKEIADLLTILGYEPFLSYESLNNKSIKKISRKHLYKIGISGFCFFNIMMLSFPEYFSIGKMAEQSLKSYFNYLSLFLAIPVVSYCSSEFYFS
ncbi:MAG: heavy metal translocating P-type ATPase metal-binding domain-containing protein, partial [Bacteroidota bacterium]